MSYRSDAASGHSHYDVGVFYSADDKNDPDVQALIRVFECMGLKVADFMKHFFSGGQFQRSASKMCRNCTTIVPFVTAHLRSDGRGSHEALNILDKCVRDWAPERLIPVYQTEEDEKRPLDSMGGLRGYTLPELVEGRRSRGYLGDHLRERTRVTEARQRCADELESLVALLRQDMASDEYRAMGDRALEGLQVRVATQSNSIKVEQFGPSVTRFVSDSYVNDFIQEQQRSVMEELVQHHQSIMDRHTAAMPARRPPPRETLSAPRKDPSAPQEDPGTVGAGHGMDEITKAARKISQRFGTDSVEKDGVEGAKGSYDKSLTPGGRGEDTELSGRGGWAPARTRRPTENEDFSSLPMESNDAQYDVAPSDPPRTPAGGRPSADIEEPSSLSPLESTHFHLPSQNDAPRNGPGQSALDYPDGGLGEATSPTRHNPTTDRSDDREPPGHEVRGRSAEGAHSVASNEESFSLAGPSTLSAMGQIGTTRPTESNAGSLSPSTGARYRVSSTVYTTKAVIQPQSNVDATYSAAGAHSATHSATHSAAHSAAPGRGSDRGSDRQRQLNSPRSLNPSLPRGGSVATSASTEDGYGSMSLGFLDSFMPDMTPENVPIPGTTPSILLQRSGSAALSAPPGGAQPGGRRRGHQRSMSLQIAHRIYAQALLPPQAPARRAVEAGINGVSMPLDSRVRVRDPGSIVPSSPLTLGAAARRYSMSSAELPGLRRQRHQSGVMGMSLTSTPSLMVAPPCRRLTAFCHSRTGLNSLSIPENQEHVASRSLHVD